MTRRLLLALSLLLAACSPGAPDAPAAAAPVAQAPPGAQGPSIYDLTAPLTDQSGQALALDVHRGHPTIITMFYASCPNACPLLIQDIKRLESALDDRTRSQVRVLLVSFTPEADTSEALTELATRQAVDLERWTLATTPEPKVRELAAVLGVRFRYLPEGHVNHASIITALDRDGRVLGRLDGLQQPVEPLAQALAAEAAR